MGLAQWESGAAIGPGIEDVRTPLHRAGDRLAYGALRGVWSLLGAAGLGGASSILSGVAALFAVADRRHRRVVEDNLAIAFPQMDAAVQAGVVAASFRNWGRIGAEAVHCDEIIEAARTNAEWTAVAAAVDEGRAKGRGLLLLTAHIGKVEV